MKKTTLIASLLAIFAIILIAFLAESPEKPSPKVVFEKKSFEVELARSGSEILRGLMFRKSLCKNCGMLFIFKDSSPRSFWMKNTLIPLDIVFIGENYEIVNISKAVPCKKEPCKIYRSKSPAKYVLEVNIGEFKKEDIGKRLEIKI